MLPTRRILAGRQQRYFFYSRHVRDDISSVPVTDPARSSIDHWCGHCRSL